MRFLIRRKAGLCRLALLFIGTCLCWMLLPAQARAATGTIADNAQVLDAAAIRQNTDQFSYTVDVFTTNVFQGSNDAFDASVQDLTSNSTKPIGSPCDPKRQVGCELFSFYTASGATSTETTPEATRINTTPGVTNTGTTPGATRINTTPEATGTADSGGSTSFSWRNSDANQSVEIGINVPARHLAIYSGKSVTIAQDHYSNAIQAFTNTMRQTHDNYTQATIAALNALQNASDRFWMGAHAAAPWFLLVALFVCPIIYAIVAQAMGWGSSSSSGSDQSNRYDRYDRWRNDTTWDSGSSGSSSGDTSDGGGGGGGASGNF